MTAAFDLPTAAEATRPPEARGLRRDEVRLLVARPAGVAHTRFAGLADHLEPGDLLVVNNSATVAAAVDGHREDGRGVVVHFSGPMGRDQGTAWVVELRPAGQADGPVTDGRAAEHVELPGGVSLRLLGAYPAGGRTSDRLWLAHVAVEGGVPAYLAKHGRPITYAYVDGRWPLASYQTVFARTPGSAEMPSAGRPFSDALVSRLVSKGVVIAPITLHTAVSSPETGEPPVPERFAVPETTAQLVNLTRSSGRRVVAVGTTATRALETVTDERGVVHADSGWTDLVLDSRRPARVVGGLVTGWHAPGASHLDLLEAVAGRELVQAAYDEALRHGYLWHEFGDSCLLLP